MVFSNEQKYARNMAHPGGCAVYICFLLPLLVLSLSACSPVHGDNEAKRVERLIVRLDSFFPWVRKKAINDLSKLGSKATTAVPDLLRVYLNENEEFHIRLAAMHAIGRIGTDDKEVIQTLVNLLDYSGDDGILKPLIAAATSVLSVLENLPAEARADLIALLNKHSSAYNSFYVLSRMGPNIVPEVLASFETGNEVAKTYILRLLEPHWEVEGVIELYSAALENRDTQVIRSAVNSLATIGEPAALFKARLIKMLRDITDFEYRFLRAEIALAIGDIGPEPAEAQAALQELLTDEAQVVRLAALLALQEKGTSIPYPVFIEILSDTDSALGLQSRLVGSSGLVVPLLSRAIKEEDEDVKLRALTMVGLLPRAERPQTLLPAIKELLEDESTKVRDAAQRLYILYQSYSSP